MSSKDDCDKCANPQLDLIASTMERVEKFGHTFIHVGRDEVKEIPSFTYTVGLNLIGFPELVVSGVSSRIAYDIMEDLIARWKKDGPKLGRIEDLVRSATTKEFLPVQVVMVDYDIHSRTHTRLVNVCWPKRRYGIAQILIPDTEGRLPSEPGYDLPASSQELLTPRITSLTNETKH